MKRERFYWRGRARRSDDVPSPAPAREPREHYAITVSAETREVIALISRRRGITMRDALSVVLADIVEAAP